MTRGQVSIRRVSPPADADHADLISSTDVVNAVLADLLGRDHFASTYAEAWQQWQPSPHKEVVRLLAEIDGRAVGRGSLNMPLSEARDVAYVTVWVVPEARRQGAGRALWAEIDRVARRAGRTRLRSWGLSPAVTGERLVARTGCGAVAGDAPGTRFATPAGFSLEQVDRVSRLDPVANAPRMRTVLAAAQAAAMDYRVLSWTGPTPEDRLDDMAWLNSRMSTDAPHGEMDVDEEGWDADRVPAAERDLAGGDRDLLTSVAEHRSTGRLVA